MSQKAEYLTGLKKELESYKKQLGQIKKTYGDEMSKDMKQAYPALQDMFRDTSSAYEKLVSASAAEWEPLKEEVSDLFEKLKDSFEDFGQTMSSKAKEYVSELKQNYQEELHRAADYISQNPFKSILWSVGLGILIGRLTK